MFMVFYLIILIYGVIATSFNLVFPACCICNRQGVVCRLPVSNEDHDVILV